MAADDKINDVELIQRIVAGYVAMHPVGGNLMLIGGFRYRLLDASVRVSADVDYHWAGDLTQKQSELVECSRRVIIPRVKRELGYSGRADAAVGPNADSPAVSIVNLSFWKEDTEYSRIEIPIEVTRIICIDSPEVRTIAGKIYATVSDGDMIESKVIALFGRERIKHRDIVDIFLFQSVFLPDSKERLKSKFEELGFTSSYISKRMKDIQKYYDYNVAAVQEVIDMQLEVNAANQINGSGGGKMVLDSVLSRIQPYIGC